MDYYKKFLDQLKDEYQTKCATAKNLKAKIVFYSEVLDLWTASKKDRGGNLFVDENDANVFLYLQKDDSINKDVALFLESMEEKFNLSGRQTDLKETSDSYVTIKYDNLLIIRFDTQRSKACSLVKAGTVEQDVMRLKCA